MRSAFLAMASALACLLACNPVHAQLRRPLLGRVIDEHGAPLANATVHFAFVPLASTRSRATDHLQATTDERGRFRVNAYPCTKYRAWVIGAVDDDGKYPLSALQFASTGQLAELRINTRREPPTVKIKGVDAWQDARPLSLRIAPTRIEIGLSPVPLADDGTAVLPPLPAANSQVDILDKHGQPLHSATLALSRKTHRTIELPPPHSLPMEVVDEAGKPVAGVRIRQRLDGGWSSGTSLGPSRPSRRIWRDLGVSDADGKLSSMISSRHDPLTYDSWQNLFFVADKEGCCDTHSGFTDHPYFDGQEVDVEDLKALKFTMRKDEPLTGRVLKTAEQGLAGQRIAVRFGVKIQSKEGNSWRNESYVRHVSTKADGTFLARGVTKFDDDITLIPDGLQAHADLVPEKLQRMAPPQPVALQRLVTLPKKPLVLAVHDLAVLKLQLLDETGGPATDAEVVLLCNVGNDYECDAWTPTAATDSAGRLAMLIEPGHWMLFARSETSYAFQHLEVKDAIAPLTLRMQPMPAMHVHVQDGEGNAIAGATVDLHSSSWHSSGNRDPGLEAIAESLNWSWIGNGKSNQDGQVIIRFLELEGMTYQARMELGRTKSQSFSVEAGEDPVTVTIE